MLQCVDSGVGTIHRSHVNELLLAQLLKILGSLSLNIRANWLTLTVVREISQI